MSVDPIVEKLLQGDSKALSRAITLTENRDPRAHEILKAVYSKGRDIPLIGITGPAGVGKSSLVDRLISIYRAEGKKVGVIAVDPSSPFSGGAILGDRIRMQQHYTDPDVFIRSMATRGKLGGIAAATFDVMDLMNAAGKDIILVETVGVGQDEIDIVKTVNTTVVVLMPGLGDEVQAMKAGLMEIADLLVVNKSDRAEAEKMEMELQNSLSYFQSHSEDEWRPRVLKTQATNNIGIDLLSEAIREHGEYLKKSGKLQGKILSQNRQRLVDALESHILTEIVDVGFERFGISRRIEDIAMRKTDPYTVVAELLEHFRME
ncbi:methylmalonyl Co-A mutase-associated GTPase MeaB [bacterium]|nr:methylmalonyl Co-A mutase-associated GTPase MeaB [bacterium]